MGWKFAPTQRSVLSGQSKSADNLRALSTSLLRQNMFVRPISVCNFTVFANSMPPECLRD